MAQPSQLLKEIAEFESTTRMRRGGKCAVWEFFQTISKPEQEAINRLIDNKEVSKASIAEFFKSKQIKIGLDSVYKHSHRGTARGCQCLK